VKSTDERRPGSVDRRDPARLSSIIRRCPMCGCDFDESEHAGCTACPLNRHCRVLCCPRCGYEFVEESWLVDRWRDLTGRLRHRGRKVKGR